MKSCGNLVRILAIIVFIIMSVVMVADHVIYAEDLKISREELEEEIDDHEEDCDGAKCSSCEYLEEREDYLNRQETRTALNTIRSILLYGIYCGILYVAGEIATRLNCTKESKDTRTPEITTAFCTRCGSERKPGALFCGVCGTSIEN